MGVWQFIEISPDRYSLLVTRLNSERITYRILLLGIAFLFLTRSPAILWNNRLKSMAVGAPNHSATGTIFSSLHRLRRGRERAWKETRFPLRGLGHRHNLLSYGVRWRRRSRREEKEKCSENSGWLIQTITPFYLCLIDSGFKKKEKESQRVRDYKVVQGVPEFFFLSFIFLTPKSTTTTIDHSSWSFTLTRDMMEKGEKPLGKLFEKSKKKEKRCIVHWTRQRGPSFQFYSVTPCG